MYCIYYVFGYSGAEFRACRVSQLRFALAFHKPRQVQLVDPWRWSAAKISFPFYIRLNFK